MLFRVSDPVQQDAWNRAQLERLCSTMFDIRRRKTDAEDAALFSPVTTTTTGRFGPVPDEASEEEEEEDSDLSEVDEDDDASVAAGAE